MYFFQILQNIMNERNLKVSDISKMTDIPDSTLRSIINRKNKTVALDVAFKISKGLNIPIEKLNDENTFSNENINQLNNKLNKLNYYFNKLNSVGQEKAIERVEELTQISKYTNSNIEFIESAMKKDTLENDNKSIIAAKGEGTSEIILLREDPEKYFQED